MATKEKSPSGIETGSHPLVPIVLGITGHRDIRPEDEQVLREAVAKIFLDLMESHYPRSPFRILSSLAPGADQLVAEVAEQHGIEVLVPLPFPAEIYATSSTFEGFPMALTKFQDWIFKRKVKSFVVPLPDGPGSTDLLGWKVFIGDDEKRHTCYANAGGYVVRHCHALIGLWDGKISGLKSGTEEIIEYKLRGQRPVFYPWHEPLGLGDEIGPVYIIHTPRVGSVEEPSSPLKPGELQVKVAKQEYILTPEELRWKTTACDRFWQLFAPFEATRQGEGNPEGLSDEAQRLRFAMWRQFIETGETIDDFNRDVADNSNNAELIQRLENKKSSTLWNLADNIRLPEDLRKLILLRETSAVLAGKLDGWFLFWQKTLFLILFFGVSSLDVYEHYLFEAGPGVSGHNPLLLCGFLVLVFICIGIATLVWYWRLNERRLDYRALAETLRVRIYWAVAGIGMSVADSYLSQLRGEISWARVAMKISAPPPAVWREYFQSQTPDHQIAQLCQVEKEWVIEQSKFYWNSFLKRHKAAGWYRARGMAIAGLGVALALGLAFSGHREHPPDVLLVAINITVLAGALILVYSERQSHEDLAKQYERMTEIFKHGASELKAYLHDDPKNIMAAQRTIIALGHEAISEHSQWLILRRNRPFEVPVP